MLTFNAEAEVLKLFKCFEDVETGLFCNTWKLWRLVESPIWHSEFLTSTPYHGLKL